MKTLLATLLLSLLYVMCSSQSVEYFGSDWKKTTKNKASFYRVISYGSDGKPSGIVRDYYSSGQLQWEGKILLFDNTEQPLYDGWCNWFYQNGKRSRASYFRAGKLNSTTYFWDENGILSGEEDYLDGLLDGAWISYYPDGQLKMFARFHRGVMEGNYYLAYDNSGNAEMVFDENFSGNSRNWNLITQPDYASQIDGNRLSMKLSNSWRLGTYLYLPLPQGDDFSVETTVSFEKGDQKGGHGLIWGFQDWDNYDYFYITSAGYLQAGSMVKGMDIPSVPFKYSASIFRGKATNVLKVLRQGKEYWFLVNNQLVGKTDFIAMAGKNAGVYTTSGAKNISFSHFVARYHAEVPATGSGENQPNSGWLGNGSGILIDPSGIIATNYHVIQDAKVIEADFYKEGKTYSFAVEVLKGDAQLDLALLKITDKAYNSFRPASLPYGIRGTTAPTGSSVFALGYPMADVLGEEIKFTDGRVSAGSGIMGDTVTYQISVPIQPGNSGGPLFDQDGNLIGITNARAKLETQNVSYAIKIRHLMNLAGKMNNSFTNTIKSKNMEQKVSILSSYVPMIRIK